MEAGRFLMRSLLNAASVFPLGFLHPFLRAVRFLRRSKVEADSGSARGTCSKLKIKNQS